MAKQVVGDGLRIKCDNIDKEVRIAILDFSRWLRKQTDFPIRLVVHVKKEKKVKNMYGELVFGTFFAPYDKLTRPIIKIATGDYYELKQKWDRDNALGAILHTIAHEIAHYEQWVKDKELNCRAARNRATRLIGRYAQTREHP